MPSDTPIDPDLETEYNQRLRVPEHPEIFEHWSRASAAARARHHCSLELSYGGHPRQRIDILHAPDPRAALTFIHGGYWRSLDKSMFSFVAEPFLAHGISVALVEYRLCPNVALGDVVEDCASALDWLKAHASRIGFPMHRHALAGHSAGGHLVTMLLARPRSALHDGLCAVASLSGLFRLQPVLHCSMNEDLRLDEQDASRWSPVSLAPMHALPLFLDVGDLETEAFRQQSGLLQRAWPSVPIRTAETAGANHFTIVEAFASGASDAAKFLIDHLVRH